MRKRVRSRYHRIPLLRLVDMGPAEAATEAARWSKEVMSQLAALHDPDMIAGGFDNIGRIGNSGVNSSIGGSWGDHRSPNSRIAKIDDAARQAALDPNIGRSAQMSAKLEPCRFAVKLPFLWLC